MTISLSSEQITELCATITPEHLENVKGFVVFVGHAHSGHSLIGALLDSLPEISITNEVNVAKLIHDHDVSVQEVMSILLATSFQNSNQKAWNNTGYSYKTETGFQGNTTKPIIIGDKKGGGNTRIIMKNPFILKKLDRLFGDKLMFVQVCRDPYDNIAAFSHYWKESIDMRHVERYFENFETVQNIKKSGIGSFYRMNYSDFINDPSREFKKLLKFLGVKAEESIIQKTLKIVRTSNNRRSEKITWPPEILAEIEKKIKIIEKK